MSNFLKGDSYTALQYGPVVVKTAVANPTSAATLNLFTVSTGTVLVTNLIGVVTTAATAGSTYTIGVTTSNKTLATALANASSVYTTMVAGATLALAPGTVSASGNTAGSSPMTTGLQGVVAPTGVNAIVPAGTITATAAGAMGGNISWYCTYVPLDFGAYVS